LTLAIYKLATSRGTGPNYLHKCKCDFQQYSSVISIKQLIKNPNNFTAVVLKQCKMSVTRSLSLQRMFLVHNGSVESVDATD